MNKLVNDLTAAKVFSSFLIFDELYRTQYGAGTEKSHLLTYKSSFVPEAESKWLAANGEAAHFTAPTGGLGAALIVHAEMYGLPAIKITAITDGHYYSSDMMVDAYENLFKHFGLGDISQIHT